MITLNHVLRANATSCILFGVVFLSMPSAVADFLSTKMQVSSVVLQILGLGLILNGLHLAWASKAISPSKAIILYFSLGDFVWVLATLALIGAGIWITTTTGIFVAMLVALLVGIMGYFQLKKLRELSIN